MFAFKQSLAFLVWIRQKAKSTLQIFHWKWGRVRRIRKWANFRDYLCACERESIRQAKRWQRNEIESRLKKHTNMQSLWIFHFSVSYIWVPCVSKPAQRETEKRKWHMKYRKIYIVLLPYITWNILIPAMHLKLTLFFMWALIHCVSHCCLVGVAIAVSLLSLFVFWNVWKKSSPPIHT